MKVHRGSSSIVSQASNMPRGINEHLFHLYLFLPRPQYVFLFQDKISGYDSSFLTTLRVDVPLDPTTTVSVSLVFNSSLVSCNEELQCNSAYPMMLTAYGAYGRIEYPSFDHRRLALLSRGMIVAIVHVRGGGMEGEAWHVAGRRLLKTNSINDLIQ